MKHLFLLSLFLITGTAFAQMDHSMHENHMEAMPATTQVEVDHSMHKMDRPKMKDTVDHSTMDHSKMDFMHHQDAEGTLTESDQAYTHINHTMHSAMNIEFSGNPDIDFLKGMIPHHQGAVDMAKVQLTYGGDGLLKGFTNRVIRDQEREIKLMKRTLKSLESKAVDSSKNRKSNMAFKHVNKAMHADMNIKFSGNADRDFVKGMIPHHKGAVDMARVVIAYGKDRNTRRLAYEIVNAQEAEISWMKRWLSRQNIMRLF